MGVAQGYVGAVVAQLADCVGFGQLGVVVVQDAEGAAGDGDADAAELAEAVCRRQVGHAGRRLGLAVHDDEALSRAGSVLAEFLL